MTHIKRLTLRLPARFAGITPQEARVLAERMIDARHSNGGLADGPREMRLADTGQNSAQIGLQAGQYSKGARK